MLGSGEQETAQVLHQEESAPRRPRGVRLVLLLAVVLSLTWAAILVWAFVNVAYWVLS
jgi:hypothetical protein